MCLLFDAGIRRHPKMSHELSRNDFPSAIWIDPLASRESAARRGWRFAWVLGAHVAVIAGGAELASRPAIRQTMQEIYVRLVELPPPLPAPAVTQKPKPLPVARKEVPRQPEPLPLLTAAVAAPAVASFVVAPQPPAPPAPPPLQSAPPPAPPAPVTAARFDADYLHNPKPVYPSISRRLNEEGTVVVRVRVSADGTALAVEVRQSSGHARLDTSALDAVQRWRFIPARQGETAIESWVAVPIAFKLES